MNHTNRIRVGVVIIKNDQLLVVRMKRNDGNDIYVLPGGSMENSEGIFDTAIRETKEETNFDIDVKKILYFKELFTEKDSAMEFIVLGKIILGSLQKGTDPEEKGNEIITDIKFVEIDKLSELNFHPRQLIKILHQDYLNGFPHSIRYLGRFNYPES